MSDPTGKIEIRDFRPDDFEAAYRLDQACFEPGIAFSRNEIRSFLSGPGTIALVAETGGRMVAFAIANRRGELGHVVTIDVAASVRRRGAGRRLLAELLRCLREAGAQRVRLEVDPRNGAAVRFYHRMGFRESRTLKDYYGRGIEGREMILED